jgi:acid phosphatase
LRPRTRRLAHVLAVSALAWPLTAAATPPLDRVVVLVMENKSYDEARVQPYTASLIAQGATFSSSFGVRHPSQPNYLALWAASTLGVTNDNCPAPGSPYFGVHNLGEAIEAKGLHWRAYSENLGSVGSAACSFDGSASTGLYTRKHDPWTDFPNLDHTNERPWSDLAADISGGTLPNLVYLIPNNCHNTHNSTTAGCGLADGDAWLAANLPAVIAALGPKGVLVLTWDEDDSSANNHILTVFVGNPVLHGVLSSQIITHYSIVRMICDAFGLSPFNSGIPEPPINNIWDAATTTRNASWGRVKSFYR